MAGTKSGGRKGLIIGGAVVGIAAVTAAVPYFLDWDWVKPVLIEAASDATGYEVAVAGDVDFGLLPSPSLSVDEVSIAGVGDDAGPLVTAESLSAGVAFWPLFSRRIEVSHIALVAPVVRLVSYADGTTNWERPEEADEGAGGENGLSIEDFRITDGRVIQVAGGEVVRTFENVDLDLTLAGDGGPLSWDGGFALDGVALATEGSFAGEELAVSLASGDDVSAAFQGRLVEGRATGRLSADAAELGAVLALMGDGSRSEEEAPAYGEALRMSARVEYADDLLTLTEVDAEIGDTRTTGELEVALVDVMTVVGRLAAGRVDVTDWQSAGPGDEAADEPFDLPEDVTADVVLS
ncbi:MAG: AsmA family protein, partial [Pacificimonas sp.]